MTATEGCWKLFQHFAYTARPACRDLPSMISGSSEIADTKDRASGSEALAIGVVHFKRAADPADAEIVRALRADLNGIVFLIKGATDYVAWDKYLHRSFGRKIFMIAQNYLCINPQRVCCCCVKGLASLAAPRPAELDRHQFVEVAHIYGIMSGKLFLGERSPLLVEVFETEWNSLIYDLGSDFLGTKFRMASSCLVANWRITSFVGWRSFTTECLKGIIFSHFLPSLVIIIPCFIVC